MNKFHIPSRLAACSDQLFDLLFKKTKGTGGREEGKVAKRSGEEMEKKNDVEEKCRQAKLFLHHCCSSFERFARLLKFCCTCFKGTSPPSFSSPPTAFSPE